MKNAIRKFAMLFLVLTCIAMIQPALNVYAASQYRVMIPAVVSTSRYTAIERETVDRINAHRRAAGCADLLINDQLSTAAERHSKDMAANNFMSHTGSDGSSAAQRITAAGYRWRTMAENVAAGYPTAADVVKGWYNSDGHRRNMLNCAFRDIGIALEVNNNTGWKYFWTTTFGAK